MPGSRDAIASKKIGISLQVSHFSPSSTMIASDTKPIPVPAAEYQLLSAPHGQKRFGERLSHQNPFCGSLQMSF